MVLLNSSKTNALPGPFRASYAPERAAATICHEVRRRKRERKAQAAARGQETEMAKQASFRQVEGREGRVSGWCSVAPLPHC